MHKHSRQNIKQMLDLKLAGTLALVYLLLPQNTQITWESRRILLSVKRVGSGSVQDSGLYTD